MCRFVAYRGDPLRVADLVLRPSNSLIHQAADAMESPTRINADGFGVGWYPTASPSEPAVFKDVSPAWNNRNLRSLADTVGSDCIFAHVRAARRNDPVSRENCHPFQYGSLLWMHNGDVPGRGRLHQRVVGRVDENLVALINGNTDTELLFTLFLSFLGAPAPRRFTTGELVGALDRTVTTAAGWWHDDKESRLLALNLCLTDGRSLVATRFARGGEPPSLHYCVGSRYGCRDGDCFVETDGTEPRCALISSEVLSRGSEWSTLEPDQLVVVDENLEIEVRGLATS